MTVYASRPRKRARLAPIRPADHPEQERAGDPDELHQQDRADEGALPDAELGAVRGRHLDDGLDAVVVDQEREQHEERLPVAAELAERLAQPHERHPHRALPEALVRFEPPGRLGDAPEQRDGEQHPPDGDAEEREPGRQGRRVLAQARPGRQAEPGRLLDPGQVEGEQDAAADVAERVAGGGDPVDLVGPRDVGQQRLVEHEAAGHADERQHEEPAREPEVAALDQEHPGHRGDAQRDERRR